jgi:hypothetical protein
MRRGQNYYGIMLVCVLSLATSTIFMLAQAPPAVGAALSQSQNRFGNDSVKGIVPQENADVLVLKRTGNIAAESTIPCCANAKAGCEEGVINCTYAKGDGGLSCFSRLFDTDSGSCA